MTVILITSNLLFYKHHHISIMEPISSKLLDDSLVFKHHNGITYIPCILLRTAIGTSLLAPKVSIRHRRIISIILLVAIVIFASKYIFQVLIRKKVLWKNYPRFVLTALVSLFLLNTGRESFAGILLIVDAMMGSDSRHVAYIVSQMC